MACAASIEQQILPRILVIFPRYKKRANIWKHCGIARDIGGYMRSRTDKVGRHRRTYYHAAIITGIAHKQHQPKSVHP